MDKEKKTATTAEPRTYYVIYRVTARFAAEVTALNPEEARNAAEEVFGSADFGAATDIEGEPVIVEDEDGEYVWEKYT